MIILKIKTEFGNIIKKQQQILKYALVGGVTQLLDFATYTILVYIGVNYVIADLANNPLVLGFNYLGHKYITFDNTKWSNKEIGRYLINLVVNYLYVTALLILLTSILNIDPVISKFITIVAIPLVNFLLLKKFVFQKKINYNIFMSIGSDLKPRIEIDALSCFRGLPDSTVNTIQHLVEEYREAGIELNVSLQASRLFPIEFFVKKLNEFDIDIGSLDLPFIIPTSEVVRDAAPNFLKVGPLNTLKLAAFSLANARSQEEFDKVVSGFISKLNERTHNQKLILRGSSGFFIEGRNTTGEALEKILVNNNDVVLTLEQDGRQHTFDEYLLTFDHLASLFPGRIFLSFDPGQLKRNETYSQAEGINPEYALDKILSSGLANKLAGFEFNTHSEELVSLESYQTLLLNLASAYKNGKIPNLKHIILEPTPFQGLAVFKKGNRGYKIIQQFNDSLV